MLDSYDSASECNGALGRMIDKYKRLAPDAYRDPGVPNRMVLEVYENTECVASDDPRLSQK
jgi:hypothetical protein